MWLRRGRAVAESLRLKAFVKLSKYTASAVKFRNEPDGRHERGSAGSRRLL